MRPLSGLGRPVLLAAAVLAMATAAASARPHRRHLARHRPAAEVAAARAPDLEARAAYASGAAFGLFDLGISGTATAVSPYAPAGYGFRRPGYYGPGYYGPGYGYPGY